MRPGKWLKRLLLVVAILLVASLGTLLVLWHMVRSQPDFYHFNPLPREQAEAAAQSATNKFATIQNQAARIRANERAARAARESGGDKSQPGAATMSGAITVTFTDTELNAFLDKWSNFQNWKASYDRYIADPVVILKDGRIILAGKLRDSNLIASLHFQPTITPDGMLDLQLARVLGGTLPLPESFVSGYETRAISALQRQLPGWKQAAGFDSSGAANRQLISASLARLLINMLGREPSDAVLFLPIFAQKGSVPVRLTQVKIDDGSMTLTVEPMTREQQEALLEHVKR